MNMPFGSPFGFPMMFGPHPMMQDQRERPIDRVPTRVAVALNVAERIAHQLTSRIACNDMTMEEFQPRGLEVEEKKLFLTACNTITSYISGTLPMTAEEQMRSRPIPVALAKCIACQSASGAPGDPNCELCGGTGSMRVIPHRISE